MGFCERLYQRFLILFCRLSLATGWIGIHSLAQRAQYPLIKEYTLNNKGIHIMI